MRHLILIIVILMLCSCKTQYIPVVETHTEYVNRTDSIEKLDSFISEKTTIIKEVDSLVMAEYGIHLQGLQRAWIVEKNSMQRTINQLKEVKADTVIVHDIIDKPLIIETNKLTDFQKLQCSTWWYLICILGLLIVRFRIKR